jgi:DNA-binding beta-propeller fold protein YncE
VTAFDVPVAGPHGLSIRDERLFCAADGGALVALHRDSGQVLGTVALPGEPDVIMHAPALDRLDVAVGSPGVVSVIDDQTLDMLETVPTGPGAHTIGWDPDRRMLYAFRPESLDVAVFVEQ